MTQKDIQTPSLFVTEDIVEILPTTTQQTISSIQPTLTSPHNKNKTPFPQLTLISTVK